MISKLKENWFIFKNAKDKFNRDKSYASELVEKANHLKYITKEAWGENSKFEDFINTNLEKYPNDIQEHLKGLVSLFRRYGNGSDNYIYVLFNVYSTCDDYCKILEKKLENNDFVGVTEYYKELIHSLKNFEEKFNIKIFDNYYIYYA